MALHSVAYLLYTHRERLARSGVLVVGPSAGFIHYVGGVLPALGESAVVFTTPGRLAHGVVASAVDPDEVARAKGGLAMLDVLRRAVADRQELPGSPIAIQLDDVTVEIDAATAAEARGRARATGLPHNAARTTFRDTLGRLLVQQGVERLDQDLEDPPEFADILRELGELADIPEIAPASTAQLTAELRQELRDDLRSDLDFHAAVERLWPVLTPEQVLAELYASPDRLASAGGGIDLSGLHRAAGSAWTVADAPLLDELAELLGPPPGPTALPSEPESAYAAEVLSILSRPTARSPARIPTSCPDRLRHRGRARGPAGARAPDERRRSGRPPTGTGGSGTWSSTRRRSSPPWTGTSCCAAARRTRSPRWATSRSAAPRPARRRGRTCSARTWVPGGPTGRSP